MEDESRKRKAITLFDLDKIPSYPQRQINGTWSELIAKTVPSDPELFFMYCIKLYQETINKMRMETERQSLDVINRVQKKIDEIKFIRSGPNYATYTKYNVECENGKTSLSSTVFLCACALITFINTHIGSQFRVTAMQFQQGFDWAMEQKVCVLRPQLNKNWTQMQIYLQLYTLASNWNTAKCQDRYHPFWFLSVIEDKVADLLTCQKTGDIINGTEGMWTRKFGNTNKLVPNPEFLDEVANMMAGLDRALILQDKLSKFRDTEIPDCYFACEDKFKVWLEEMKNESVIPDWLDEVRANAIYYCLREGEVEKSLRKNNGVKKKSIKWVLHDTRSYQQILWMTQQHSYDKLGKPLKIYPRKWQDHFMKLNVFVNLVGGYAVKLFDGIYIRERDFWNIYTSGYIQKNPFIVEVMGDQFVISKGYIYRTETVDQALLLWTVLFERDYKFRFSEEAKVIDMSAIFDPLVAAWRSRVVLDPNAGEDDDVIM